MTEFLQNWQPIIYSLSIIIGAGIIGLIAHYIVFRILSRVSKRTQAILDDAIVRHSRRPSKYLIILLAINIVMPLVQFPENVLYILNSLFRPLFILSVSWLVISFMSVGEDVILSRYDIKAQDNLKARKIQTQIQVIKRIIAVIIIIVAVALILLGFESFQQIGAGILASAGLASVVIGLAAQKIIGNFLAGIQIAFAQPIRVDDVVIVENEWGNIEEITLTYVVVRIWDLRRLVLPISYFIEKPFQNWTRVSADLLGTVFVYTDYTVPVNEVRQELARIAKSSDKWDGKVCGLQVTNTTEHTMELRALVSAEDSSKAWDLRCEVREKLIEFIQNKYPAALPKTRAELSRTGDYRTP